MTITTPTTAAAAAAATTTTNNNNNNKILYLDILRAQWHVCSVQSL